MIIFGKYVGVVDSYRVQLFQSLESIISLESILPRFLILFIQNTAKII